MPARIAAASSPGLPCHRLPFRRWRPPLVVSSLCVSVALASTTVTQLTVEGGQSHIVVDSGQILTAPNPSATTVQVQNNGTLIFWSGGGVHLEPGFHAASGSFFWAAVDTDMNGYSDQEEITDTDGDGMPDAWEVDHGLNPIVNDAIADLDGDGLSNLNEYLTHRNPNDPADAKALPSGVQVVLRTPSSQYYGVAPGTWAIAAVPGP